MPARIVTVSTFEEAADVIVRLWKEAGSSEPLRLEGFDGVGKSGLAKLVVSRIGAVHVEGDKFAFKPDVPKPYWECLRSGELERSIKEAFGSGKPVILDAVCLDMVAPSARWGRGFVVYVKRLSFNNYDPIWHRGFDLEDEESSVSDEPHRGILQYHRHSKPHESADLIIELPQDGDAISNFAFDRNNCFDPVGAEVLSK